MQREFSIEEWRRKFPHIVIIDKKRDKLWRRTLIKIECSQCQYVRWARPDRLDESALCKYCAHRKSPEQIKRELPGIKILKVKYVRGEGPKVRIVCPGILADGSECMKTRWVKALDIRKRLHNKGKCQACANREDGHIDQHGYKIVCFSGKSVKEHRLIMGKMIGRKLYKGETVHHKNGKRADNREINLELRMSGNHPRGWSLQQMREYLKTVPKRLGGLK